MTTCVNLVQFIILVKEPTVNKPFCTIPNNQPQKTAVFLRLILFFYTACAFLFTIIQTTINSKTINISIFQKIKLQCIV